jgi:hypothetical protein
MVVTCSICRYPTNSGLIREVTTMPYDAEEEDNDPIDDTDDWDEDDEDEDDDDDDEDLD